MTTHPTDPRDPAPGAGQLDPGVIPPFTGKRRPLPRDVSLLAAVADLRAENARYRAALERYATEVNWSRRWVADGSDAWTWTTPGPDIAREALAGGTVLRYDAATGLFVREPAGAVDNPGGAG